MLFRLMQISNRHLFKNIGILTTWLSFLSLDNSLFRADILCEDLDLSDHKAW